MNEEILQHMQDVDSKIEDIEFYLNELKDLFQVLCDTVQED